MHNNLNYYIMKELNSIELQNINGGLSEVSTSILEGMATFHKKVAEFMQNDYWWRSFAH